ncbi:Stathmin [Sesbania bispinosa]|nr:Stathmin [Sesbania bispinosa]
MAHPLEARMIHGMLHVQEGRGNCWEDMWKNLRVRLNSKYHLKASNNKNNLKLEFKRPQNHGKHIRDVHM